MSKEAESETILREEAVEQVRKGGKQFAMLYFHFVKTLVDSFGIEKAKELTQQAIFNLGLERTNALRSKAEELGLEYTIENMIKITDIPFLGWDKSRGQNHCPYGEQWMTYYSEYPWFAEFAPFYCDIIDTTNCENFTRDTTHKITKNVLRGDNTCERVYYPSEEVKKGEYTYGRQDTGK
jgi:hypothetical protein